MQMQQQSRRQQRDYRPFSKTKNSNGCGLNDYDLANLQVLRGPQVMLFEPQRPTDRLEVIPH